MAEQVGPTPDMPITTLALEAAVNDWHPGCGFHHGRGSHAIPTRGRRYVCSPIPFAVISPPISPLSRAMLRRVASCLAWLALLVHTNQRPPRRREAAPAGFSAILDRDPHGPGANGAPPRSVRASRERFYSRPRGGELWAGAPPLHPTRAPPSLLTEESR